MTRAAALAHLVTGLITLLALTPSVSAQVAAPAPPSPAPSPSLSVPTVLISEQPCTPSRYDADALWKALQVELGELGVLTARLLAGDDARASQAVRTSLALISVGCAEGPHGLWLRVSDTATGKELTRTLDTADISPTSQPRALALAVVALLESSWSEVVSEDAHAQPQSTLPASVQAIVRARLSRKLLAQAPEPPPAVPTARRETRWQPFEAAVILRGFPSRNTGMLGLQFGVMPSPAAAMRLVLTAEGLWGRSELSNASGDRVGVLQLYWLTAGGGLSWHEGTNVEVEAGPRVLIGYGFAAAEAASVGTSAKNGSGLVLTTLLSASVRAPLGPVRLITGFDIGYTLVGVVFVGDQSRLSGMADVTFALHNGLAW